MKSIPDCVPSAKTDPLRDGAVLFLGASELLLRAEGFVGLYLQMCC